MPAITHGAFRSGRILGILALALIQSSVPVCAQLATSQTSTTNASNCIMRFGGVIIVEGEAGAVTQFCGEINGQIASHTPAPAPTPTASGPVRDMPWLPEGSVPPQLTAVACIVAWPLGWIKATVIGLGCAAAEIF